MRVKRVHPSAIVDGAMIVWEIASGKEKKRFLGGEPVLAVVFTRDGKRLLSGGAD